MDFSTQAQHHRLVYGDIGLTFFVSACVDPQDVVQGTKRPQQECKARYLMLLRAQAQARLKAAGAQPQENGDVKAAPGPAQTLNDLITLRERLAALIATRHVCHRTVRIIM